MFDHGIAIVSGAGVRNFILDRTKYLRSRAAPGDKVFPRAIGPRDEREWGVMEIKKAKPRKNKYPAEGVTLEMMVTKLSEVYGWERLGEKVRVRCFTHDPSVKSSLQFLRRTPWAREKVEKLYVWRSSTGWDPRDNAK